MKLIWLDLETDRKKTLRQELQELVRKERKMRGLRFEDVRIRGYKETFEQFKRNWDMDF